VDRNYTLAITSCGRPHLLKKTVESFLQMAEQGPREIIVIDDSGMEQPDWFPRHNVRWIANSVQIGLVASLDKLYSHIQTEAVFHCEDDWLFYDGGFIGPSFWMLEEFPGISTVSLRRDYRWTKVLPYAPNGILAEGIEIFSPANGWNGITFNPGLRRLSDYVRFGSYGRVLGYGRCGLEDAYAEHELSRQYLRLGYNVAALPRHSYHIGDESHVPRSDKVLPKILVAIPTAKVLDYSDFRARKIELGRHAPAAGISGLQKDGPNARQEAVRDTWLKDASVHKNLSVEFFDGPRCGCQDDHMHVIDKTLYAANYALANSFDYLFKCDDDTFVHLDRLVRMFLELPADIDAAGYVECGGFYGGPGFLLSRKALKEVVKLVPQDRRVEWREDWWIGSELVKLGYKLHHLMQLKDKWRETPPLETVTLHPLSPDEMRAMYQPLP
jgi:hypothetical protein